VEKTNEQMDEAVYLQYLQKVKEGDLIALRGGEPFFSYNFMHGFLKPAIDKGIHVLVESNGQFTGMPNYEQCLDMLAHENVEVRLSLDRDHFDFLGEDMRQDRLKRLAKFIKDAEAQNIKFSFTALGLDQKQIKEFLKENDFESYVKHIKIKPLTKYSRIEDLPLTSKYIDVQGAEHDHIINYSDRTYSLYYLNQRTSGGVC
jgi:pyruvate-formate lyase-activating enzyme